MPGHGPGTVQDLHDLDPGHGRWKESDRRKHGEPPPYVGRDFQSRDPFLIGDLAEGPGFRIRGEEEMATGGIGWFIDLTQPDPYLFLPILSNFLLFSAHELGADETGRPRQELPNRWLRYGVRGFKIGLFGLWFFLPSSILCFWIPHSALSCLQTVVFSQPTVIQSFGFGRGGRDHPVPTNMAENDYSEIQYYKDAANEESQVKANKTEKESSPKPSILSPVRIRKGRKKPNVNRRKNK